MKGGPTHHPFFARLYVRFAEEAARKGADDHRRELLSGCRGTVLEVGAGHGASFPSYPPRVDGVLAVEPEGLLRRLARRAAARAPVPVHVVAGLAEDLPLADRSVDAVVASLVLCSVPDQRRALDEIRRVLRPGGELRFYEHVRAEGRVSSTLQRAVDPVWSRLTAGCHTHRDTVGAIDAAGFAVQSLRRFPFRPTPFTAPATPHVIGWARRR